MPGLKVGFHLAAGSNILRAIDLRSNQPEGKDYFTGNASKRCLFKRSVIGFFSFANDLLTPTRLTLGLSFSRRDGSIPNTE